MSYNLRGNRSKKRIVEDPSDEDFFETRTTDVESEETPRDSSDENDSSESSAEEISSSDEISSNPRSGFLAKLFSRGVPPSEVAKDREYESEVPLDQVWKNHPRISPLELPVLEKSLAQIRKDLAESEPTMDKILTARLSNSARQRAILLFDAYQNLQNHTEGKIESREVLVKILSDAQKKSLAEFELESKVESEEVRLGTVTPASYEMNMKMKIISLQTTDEIKTRLLQMFGTISARPFDESSQTIRGKLELATNLPYGKVSASPVEKPAILQGRRNRRGSKSTRPTVTSPEEIRAAYLIGIRKILDDELYGMGKVKDELIEILNNRLCNKNAAATIALQGPPGTGKTAIVSALAKALKLPFERVCLGGMTDCTVLKGSEGHWIGSSASVILKFLRRSGVSDGILLFDELDKLSVSDGAQEIQNALLHITDYTQNYEFQDTYLSEFTHDISRIWFIFALNDDSKIDPISKERLSFVQVPGYSKKELGVIITKHLLPKAIENCGLRPGDVTITTEGCEKLISKMVGNSRSGSGTGVRNVKRGVYSLVSKINLLKTFQGKVPETFQGRPFPGTVAEFSLPISVDSKIVDRLVEDAVVEKIPDIYS